MSIQIKFNLSDKKECDEVRRILGVDKTVELDAFIVHFKKQLPKLPGIGRKMAWMICDEIDDLSKIRSDA